MIDPIEFGKLQAKVESFGKELDEIRQDVKLLVEMANKSRGALWVGMGLASILGGIGTFIAERLWR